MHPQGNMHSRGQRPLNPQAGGDNLGASMLSDLQQLNLISSGAPNQSSNTTVVGKPDFGAQQIQRNLNQANQNLQTFDDDQLSSIFSLALDDTDSNAPPGFAQAQSPPPPGFNSSQRNQPPGFSGNHNTQTAPPRMQMPNHQGGPRPSGPSSRMPMAGIPPPNFMNVNGQAMPRPGLIPRGPWNNVPRGVIPPPNAMMGLAGPHSPIPGMQPNGGNQNVLQDPYSFERFRNPNAGGRMRLNDSFRMKGYELFNMIRIQGSAGQTGDSYTDDFYFHKMAEQKRKNASSMTGSSSASPDKSADSIRKSDISSRPGALLSEMMVLHNEGVKAIKPSQFDVDMGSTPLPELPGMVRMPKEYEIKRNKAAKEWHETQKVLGQNQKSNLKTPRALINFTTESLDEDGAKVFSRPEWKLKKLAAEVADIILEIEDVHRLLRAKVKVLNMNISGDVSAASNSVTAELEAKQVQLCDKLGTLLGFSSVADGVISLNQVQLRGILWTNKGRKLLCRAAGCLLPMHHAALIDAVASMMVYFVCLAPEGLDSTDKHEREKAEVDMFVAHQMAMEISGLSLDRTTECLSKFLSTQNPDSLRAVIATPGGAELIRSTLMHGQKKSEETECDSTAKNKWSETFGKFLSMAEEGVNSQA
eukprot:CAMPEP_0184028918 /NCGR_PEP_ID=MMETSP0954-20121128/15125_1 /TAXON_ID=627963 /ORGANISM="Aplanochytrium sp, Strain PBS07" /LENGTH=642 /DNA_ID=CAMNT_0026313851 /DNA_START=75 /DNA_END=2003 /DNA_ORIENTATION=+